jgi:hypothetical protein
MCDLSTFPGTGIPLNSKQSLFLLGSEAVPETDGSQPKPKRFKRRNQAIYCSVDDG